MNVHGLEIISTKEWGARAPRGRIYKRIPRNVIIHHMATANPPSNISRRSAKTLAKECQGWHFGNGWVDTGQHFTIACDGTILEGRAGSIDALLDRECIGGGHCVGHNNDWGIEVEGHHSSVPFTAAQKKSLIELCSLMCFYSDIQSQDIYGHSEFNRTECPGDAGRAFLPELRKAVHDRKIELMGK